MGTTTLVSTPGRRLKDTDAGRSQCALMHCSLFLTQGSTIKKTLSVYEGSFRGDPGPGTILAVANKYLAPYIQPNHDPLLSSYWQPFKVDLPFWMPMGKIEVVAFLLLHHLSLTSFLPDLRWQEFVWTQKSVRVLCFYLHRCQVRNNCELFSVLRIRCAQCWKAQECFQNVLWSLLGRNSWNVCPRYQQAALILWAKTQAESQ